MPKKKKAEDPGVPEWVVTYGDLMSLLLCFFILLAAFSELKQPREFRKVLDQIREALGYKGGVGIAPLLENPNNSMVSEFTEMARWRENERTNEVNEIKSVPGRAERTDVIQEGNRVTVGGALEYEPGAYQVSEPMAETLRTHVAPMIRDQKYIVLIVGHSWGPEDARASGMTHDQLSYKRAEAVKQFLVRECGVDPSILRVEVAGDREPASVSGAGAQQGAGNRRVQVYQTGRTVGDVHPDPNFTGREG